MSDYVKLNKVLNYCPNTGVLSWCKTVSNSAREGQEAGSNHNKGYRFIRYQGKFYFTHKVAWLLFYKDWPSGEIDHINGDKKDNRINNLRVVTRQQQMTNTPSKKNSSSRFKGVTWHKVNKKWRVQIAIKGVKYHLGMFDDEREAALMYNYAAMEAWGKHARFNNVF